MERTGGRGRPGGPPDSLRLRDGLHGARPSRGRHPESDRVHQRGVQPRPASTRDRHQGRGQAEDLLQQLRHGPLPGDGAQD